MLTVPGKAMQTPHGGNGKSEAAGSATAVPLKPEHTKKEKGAWLATLGAVFTAIVGSACCWLPLLVIAFGFSAAGVGSFFEQYRPYFLSAAFALLGLAWYLTYRTALKRTWWRLSGKQGLEPAVEACCATGVRPAAGHSCCATDVEPADNRAAQTWSTSSQVVRQRFSVRQFNQVMLWIATVAILLFALFPHWSGLILGDRNASPAASLARVSVSADHAQIVLKVDGMTCEGCAATVRQALRKVPGVSHVEVNYARSQAVVTIDGTLAPDTLIQAVQDAGYDAQVKK